MNIDQIHGVVSILGRASNCTLIPKKFSYQYKPISHTSRLKSQVNQSLPDRLKSNQMDSPDHPSSQLNQSSSTSFLESIILKLGGISAQAIRSKQIRVLTGATAHRIERNLFHHLLRQVDVNQQLTLRDMKYIDEMYFLVKDKCMNFTLFKHDFLLLGRETLRTQHDAEAMATFNERMSVILGSRGSLAPEGLLNNSLSSTDEIRIALP